MNAAVGSQTRRFATEVTGNDAIESACSPECSDRSRRSYCMGLDCSFLDLRSERQSCRCFSLASALACVTILYCYLGDTNENRSQAKLPMQRSVLEPEWLPEARREPDHLAARRFRHCHNPLLCTSGRYRGLAEQMCL